jgi:uncharacterized protein YqcC (DUF446 family)
MPSNACVKFLVPKSQLENLKLSAAMNGFNTLSGYIRNQLLSHENYENILAKLENIEELLNEVKENGKKSR